MPDIHAGGALVDMLAASAGRTDKPLIQVLFLQPGSSHQLYQLPVLLFTDSENKHVPKA
jgi:hypothetical protein